MLVRDVLQDEKGVVDVVFDENELGFARSILIGSSQLLEHVPKLSLIWLALQKLAREGEMKPTFVVKVNDRCTRDQLEKLLLLGGRAKS